MSQIMNVLIGQLSIYPAIQPCEDYVQGHWSFRPITKSAHAISAHNLNIDILIVCCYHNGLMNFIVF